MHPITIYLSPTSTAVINVTQIEPSLKDPTRRPFGILSPQAEVIVAPKLRQPLPVESEGAFDLTGARNSVASTTKSKKSRRKVADPSLLLRTICLPHPTFEDEIQEDTLCVYVDPFLKMSPVFAGGFAKMSILPSPSRPPVVADKDKDNTTATNEAEFTLAKQIVAKVQVWEEAPEDHIGLSPRLVSTLGIHGLGDLARFSATVKCTNGRITPAGSPVKKTPSKLIFHPFSSNNPEKSNGLKISGDKARQKEEAAAKDKEISTSLHQSLRHVFNSPITECMRVLLDSDTSKGGIISFAGHAGDWFQPRNPEDYTISLGKEVPDPTSQASRPTTSSRKIVSIDKLLDKAEKTLSRNGSVLVCGGRGSGKTAALNQLSQRMYTHLIRTSPLVLN